MSQRFKYPLLYNSINNYVPLTEKAYLALEKRLSIKHIEQKDYLLREGQVIDYMPFINKGLMVNYRNDEKGRQHVLQIRCEGWWLGDLYSFFYREVSMLNIIAYKPTELLLINEETFDYITANHPIYERYFRIAFQKSYISTLSQIYNLHSTSAEERYLQLIKTVPTILEDIPHYLVASYLNIRPQSLSRIRKKISGEELTLT